MKSCENKVAPDSDYYVYSPSMTAKEIFFYPICTGRFIYEPGYLLKRDSYDSFLIMYVRKGRLTVLLEDREEPVPEGSFVLADCCRPHAYYSDKGWEGLWCHFDGVMAEAYYRLIRSRLGNVFRMEDPYPVLSRLSDIYHMFAGEDNIKEALLSRYLTDILTALMLYVPKQPGCLPYTGMTEGIMSYINENFSKPITNGQLAFRAGLSQYHFSRIFKRETGFSPHGYLVHTRIHMAKYMLKNTMLPVKDICFNSGFTSESVFCSAFKKHTGMTPGEYRG